MDAQGWAVVVTAAITAIFLGIGQLLTIYLQAKANKDRLDIAKATDEKMVAIAEKAAQKQDKTDEKIEVIHHATNSMKDALVQEVRAASFAAGQKEEKEKGDGAGVEETKGKTIAFTDVPKVTIVKK